MAGFLMSNHVGSTYMAAEDITAPTSANASFVGFTIRPTVLDPANLAFDVGGCAVMTLV